MWVSRTQVPYLPRFFFNLITRCIDPIYYYNLNRIVITQLLMLWSFSFFVHAIDTRVVYERLLDILFYFFCVTTLMCQRLRER